MTPTMDQIEQLAATSTELLLLSGGDARLHIDPASGVNKYGCAALPDHSLVAFGSSTGSTISSRGFAAAQSLHLRLLNHDGSRSEPELYRHELERVRTELDRLCGFSGNSGNATIFAASGTDLHLICAQLLGSPDLDQPPLHIIMMDASETGSGVAPAVRGHHFSENAALGGRCTAYTPLHNGYPVNVTNIGLRGADGQKRPIDQIDADVERLIEDSLAIHQRVLLIMIDVSKTGLIAPSPSLVAALLARHAGSLDILVDACQFRISNATLDAYLQHGCMVALTGSKFLTGPVFSGILQIPRKLVPRLSHQTLPSALAEYTARGEWPAHWVATRQLTDKTNWGLLLRLEAALAELKAFRSVPDQFINHFLQRFSTEIRQAISHSPHFELCSETVLHRAPIHSTAGWDQIPTIFPFLLLHAPGHPVSRAETQQVYRQLQLPVTPIAGQVLPSDIAEMRVQLGQPVLCGTQYGVEVSALRMCASSRLIAAASLSKDTENRIIQQAKQALIKAEYLIRNL